MHQATRRLKTLVQQTVAVAAVPMRETRKMFRGRGAKLRCRIVRIVAARVVDGARRTRVSTFAVLRAWQQPLEKKSGPESVGASAPTLVIAHAASVTAAARMGGRVKQGWAIGVGGLMSRWHGLPGGEAHLDSGSANAWTFSSVQT